MFTLQRSTMLYEAGRHYRYAVDLAPGQIGEKFLSAVREGLAMPFDRYVSEARELSTLSERLLAGFADADAFLWPAAPAAAPKGLGWTGDPRFISPWTAIGGPIVTIPTGATADGLPLGCILTAAPGRDAEMCSLARAVGEIAEREFS
jgi:Asp-tRNA(Asn)/Glu-tRNA(Gln) amidotransferase A subunit family amidase